MAPSLAATGQGKRANWCNKPIDLRLRSSSRRSADSSSRYIYNIRLYFILSRERNGEWLSAAAASFPFIFLRALLCISPSRSRRVILSRIYIYGINIFCFFFRLSLLGRAAESLKFIGVAYLGDPFGTSIIALVVVRVWGTRKCVLTFGAELARNYGQELG